MKKILISLALLLGIISMQAQDWRGFLEIHAGTSPMKSTIEFNNATVTDLTNSLTFGLNYTMGVAVLPQLYAGVGIGGYTSLTAYRDIDDYLENTFSLLYFPVFANIRWIPDITRKINPFVDLKIGYQMGVDLDNNDLWIEYHDRDKEYYIQHRNGLFLQPGVGIRFGRESAFNLGLAYNVILPQDFVAKDIRQANMPVLECIKKSFGSIMITFGADF